MTTLAIELRDAKTRDWRWWQLARHTRTIRQIVLAFGLACVLVGALVDRLSGALQGAVAGVLVFGLAGGDRDTPAHADLRLRGRATALGSALAGTVAPCLVVVLGNTMVGKLGIGLRGELAFWLGAGLAVGLMLGLINFATSPSIARRASSPAESQRGDRRLTVLVTSTLWLASALASWLAFWLGWHVPRLVSELAHGMVYGLWIGLFFMLAMAKTCWPGFVVASLWLGVRRRLSWRLMGFLDDAYRLGLLGVVGPVYQFRHAALQDHLAPPAESMTTEAADPSTPLRT